jgi:hypothetical protein
VPQHGTHSRAGGDVVAVPGRVLRITLTAALASTWVAAPAAARRHTAHDPAGTVAPENATAVRNETAAVAETTVEGGGATADLGVVAVGERARHAFRIRNDGDRALALRVLRMPPGATVATPLPTTIAAGATGRIEVALDAVAFAGSPRLEVVLATDDPARAEIRLALRAEVRAFVVADPGFARYIFVQGAREGTIAQTIWATDGADFRVTGVTSPFPYLRVRAREARGGERAAGVPGRQWRVESTLTAEPPVGPLAGFVEVRLDHPRQRRLLVPVSGFVRPMFAVTPPAAELGDVHAGAPVPGRLVVQNFADEGVALERATSDVTGVGSEITTVERGHVFRIRLTIAGDAAPGEFRGVLRIRTASPKVPVLEVPLHGRIVARAETAAAAGGARLR